MIVFDVFVVDVFGVSAKCIQLLRQGQRNESAHTPTFEFDRIEAYT